MKKILFTILMVALLIGTARAVNSFGDTYHEVQVVDETGRNVEDITNLYIYLAGTTTNATIYSDKGRQNTITIPMTEATTNTTLVDGQFSWWGPDKYDFSMTNTDGVGPMTNSGHADRDSSGGILVFPTYLTSITTSSWLDAESITMGTGADWVINGGGTADTLAFTPASDNSAVNFGTSGTSLNTDFNIYVGTALGFKLDAGVPSLIIDGLTTSINTNSNFATNVNTGTSTGAINLGSSTAGAIAVETTTTFAVIADDSATITTTAASGDITLDGSAGSVIIRGTEEAGDAIYIHADGTAGGIDITSGTGDIVLLSTDDISLTVATTTSDNIIFTNTAGTGEDAFNIDATAGGIDIDFATAKNMAVTGGQFIFTSNENVASAFSVITNTGTAETITLVNTQGTAAGAIAATASAGGITLTADGATAGDITIDSEDDLILTSTGKVTITNTEAVTVSGALTVTGDTQLVSVTRIDTPIEALTATKNAEITDSGKVFILNHATEFATTLPTVATSTGVTLRFVCKLAPDTGSFTVLTDSLEDTIVGSATVNGAAVAADGPDDTITFTASAAAIGDWVELTCDGTYWYLSGQGVAATAIVPSKAD